ncbi:MAG TPA: HAMP domain-containing protein, partial [Methylomirabilota bacterium]|nr:HAMP domain-containing protein [Methylomirabilota bacterium]
MTRWRFRSLQARLLAGTVLVIVLVMAAAIAVVDHRQRAAIIEEVERRGEVLARNLAALSQAPLLLYNFTALEQNVARIAAEEDVLYAIVLDGEGRVAAHSRHPERVGMVLDGAVGRRATEAREPIVQQTEATTGEQTYDFAVPVLIERQRWGTVRVGLSKRRMESEISRTRWELGFLTVVTLLAGGLAAGLVARRIAGPVQQLVEGAAAISRGDFRQRIEPSTEDEIGRLAVAFNHMATQLFQQRSALEEANTELRRRLEEVADLKTYTDNILASLTNGIVTIDLEGRIVTLNPSAELMTGFFAGEVVGRYCTEVFAQTPEVGEILMETLAARVGVQGAPFTLRRRNGRALHVEFSTAPLKAGEGKDLGVVGVFRDLTVLRELEHRLRRSDRLAAVGTLAAGLAHEIKNPLTSLLTFSRHLTRRFEDEQFRVRFQSVVPRELERINGIVERLLELARPPRLQFTTVRLPGLLDRVLELY